MTKQPRILIGDAGDAFATICAHAFQKTNCWAITRRQFREELLRAIREEHPDLLILNVALPTMDFASFTDEVLTHTTMHILALFHSENLHVEGLVQQDYVHCRRFPHDAAELVQDAQHWLGMKIRPVEEAKVSTVNLEIDITNLLRGFGISANLQGFHYLRRAILIAYQQTTCSCAMSSSIYPAVAEQFQSTASRVERSIRHAISNAWDRAKSEGTYSYYHMLFAANRRLTNSEFIAFAVDWLRMEYTEQKCG